MCNIDMQIYKFDKQRFSRKDKLKERMRDQRYKKKRILEA